MTTTMISTNEYRNDTPSFDMDLFPLPEDFMIQDEYDEYSALYEDIVKETMSLSSPQVNIFT